MNGTGGEAQPASGLRIVRRVVPWFVLAAVVLVGMMIITGFQGALRSAKVAAAGPGSVTATASTEPTASTAVTGTVAVTRVTGVRLHFAADTRSDTLAIAKKGAKLEVLSRTDKWLRVKDAAGHIGWVANTAKTLQIRKK